MCGLSSVDATTSASLSELLPLATLLLLPNPNRMEWCGAGGTYPGRGSPSSSGAPLAGIGGA